MLFYSLKNPSQPFGGELQKKKNGRGRRPLDDSKSMHITLKSSQAKGEWSFLTRKNRQKIQKVIERFSNKYNVMILKSANVGNHIHLHIQLIDRKTYTPFIRAITAAITMAVTGASRCKKLTKKFFDYRPFSKIVTCVKQFVNLNKYLEINEWEAVGCDRLTARMRVEEDFW